MRKRKKPPPGGFSDLPKQAHVWCPRGDSNPHDLRRYHLKVVRLPIPPPGLKNRWPSGPLPFVADVPAPTGTRLFHAGQERCIWYRVCPC